MRPIIHKTTPGARHGQLVAQRPDPEKPDHWIWRCDCGTEKSILTRRVVTNGTKACGCKRQPHGQSRTQVFSVWGSMIERCHTPTHRAYARYGGRGITVCARWRENFNDFVTDMGPRPPGRSIDRIDNDGNYEPDNCRWATRTEQQRNTRRNIRLTHAGETLTLSEWSERTGIGARTISARLGAGWPVARALSTPPRSYRRAEP